MGVFRLMELAYSMFQR